MQERLDFAVKLAACLGGVSVSFLSLEAGEVQAAVRKSIYARLPGFQEKNMVSFLEKLGDRTICLVAGMVDLSYGVLRYGDMYLSVGPCFANGFSESRIRTQLGALRVTGAGAEQMIAQLRQIPVLNRETLQQSLMLMGKFLLGLQGELPVQNVEYHWAVSHVPIQPEEEQEREVFHIRMVERRYEASALLTEAVKQGNFSLAYEFIHRVSNEQTQMLRNPNPLRNTQNMCIVLNTQLRHAMEDCGVHPYRLDTVSGKIGTEIEKLRSSEAALTYCEEIVRRYCELALEQKFPNANRLVRQAVIYVKNHLADNVTVKDTAAALQVNANYFSGLFCKEMGMPFIAFLNKERAVQAAALLRKTDMPIRRIAALVGYNNTSYFARQFALNYGCSPKDYRQAGKP